MSAAIDPVVEPQTAEPRPADTASETGPRPRRRRPEPARTGPIRNASTFFRGEEAPSDAPPPDSDAERDFVSQGVAAGYRVVEEHIRQGRETARKIHGAVPEADVVAADLRSWAQQTLRYTTDAVSLGLSLLGSLSANLQRLGGSWPGGWPGWPGGGPSSGGPSVGWPGLDTDRPGDVDGGWPGRGGGGDEPAPGSRIAVEIASARPARVSLDLDPAVERGTVPAHDLRLEFLRPAEPGGRALDRVALEGGAVTVLRVHVPPDQPPDVYTGRLLDLRTGRVRGVVTVRILE